MSPTLSVYSTQAKLIDWSFCTSERNVKPECKSFDNSDNVGQRLKKFYHGQIG